MITESTPLNQWSENDLLKLLTSVDYLKGEMPNHVEYQEFADRVTPIIKEALKTVLLQTYTGNEILS